MDKKIYNWLYVILWAGLIFYLSHQPDLKSSLPSQYDFILRKLAHISEYAVLTWLLIRALNQYSLPMKKVLIYSFSLALLYAVSDEIHQRFIALRFGTVRDVLIDSIGILVTIWHKWRNKKQPKKLT